MGKGKFCDGVAMPYLFCIVCWVAFPPEGERLLTIING